MKHQLYFVAIGRGIYWSTNITEISDFADTWGEIGNIDFGSEVSFEIPNVICIHAFN